MLSSDVAVTIDSPDWANALVREWEKVKGQMRPVLVYIGPGKKGEELRQSERLPLKVGNNELRVFRWPKETYLEVGEGEEKRYYSKVEFGATNGKQGDDEAVLVAEFPAGMVEKFMKGHGYRVIGVNELMEEQVPPPDVAVERWKGLLQERESRHDVGGGKEKADDSVFAEYGRLVGEEKMGETLKRYGGLNREEIRDKLRWALTRAYHAVGVEELVKRGVDLPSDVREEVQRVLERRAIRNRGSGD